MVKMMNMKRFLGAAIVLFGFIFAYEWVVHGMLLTQIYESTASVWRPHEQMVSFLPMNILSNHPLSRVFLSGPFPGFVNNFRNRELMGLTIINPSTASPIDTINAEEYFLTFMNSL